MNGRGTAPPDYSTSFQGKETGEASFQLTYAQPSHLNINDNFYLSGTDNTIWAFSAAQYSVKIYALDSTNAQLFLNNQPFQGYLLGGGASGTGMHFPRLPPGWYWIGTIPDQTVFQGYTNSVYHEVAYERSLPKWVQSGNVPMAPSGIAGSWQSQGFTIPTGDVRAYIETEGYGGKFMIMNASQYISFSQTYANGFNGGSYAFIYACGGQTGGAAIEIECELKLPPGDYTLVYLNDTASWAGGAANIEFYVPQ